MQNEPIGIPPKMNNNVKEFERWLYMRYIVQQAVKEGIAI